MSETSFRDLLTSSEKNFGDETTTSYNLPIGELNANYIDFTKKLGIPKNFIDADSNLADRFYKTSVAIFTPYTSLPPSSTKSDHKAVSSSKNKDDSTFEESDLYTTEPNDVIISAKTKARLSKVSVPTVNAAYDLATSSFLATKSGNFNSIDKLPVIKQIHSKKNINIKNKKNNAEEHSQSVAYRKRRTNNHIIADDDDDDEDDNDDDDDDNDNKNKNVNKSINLANNSILSDSDSSSSDTALSQRSIKTSKKFSSKKRPTNIKKSNADLKNTQDKSNKSFRTNLKKEGKFQSQFKNSDDSDEAYTSAKEAASDSYSESNYSNVVIEGISEPDSDSESDSDAVSRRIRVGLKPTRKTSNSPIPTLPFSTKSTDTSSKKSAKKSIGKKVTSVFATRHRKLVGSQSNSPISPFIAESTPDNLSKINSTFTESSTQKNKKPRAQTIDISDDETVNASPIVNSTGHASNKANQSIPNSSAKKGAYVNYITDIANSVSPRRKSKGSSAGSSSASNRKRRQSSYDSLPDEINSSLDASGYNGANGSFMIPKMTFAMVKYVSATIPPPKYKIRSLELSNIITGSSVSESNSLSDDVIFMSKYDPQWLTDPRNSWRINELRKERSKIKEQIITKYGRRFRHLSRHSTTEVIKRRQRILNFEHIITSIEIAKKRDAKKPKDRPKPDVYKKTWLKRHDKFIVDYWYYYDAKGKRYVNPYGV